MDEPTARELMTSPVRKLKTSQRVQEAIEFLTRWGISGAPVLDPRNRPAGVFTLRDLARALAGDMKAIATRRVSDLMTPFVSVVFESAPLSEIVRKINAEKIHRLFVVSTRGEIKGVISTTDLVRWMEHAEAAS